MLCHFPGLTSDNPSFQVGSFTESHMFPTKVGKLKSSVEICSQIYAQECRHLIMSEKFNKYRAKHRAQNEAYEV